MKKLINCRKCPSRDLPHTHPPKSHQLTFTEFHLNLFNFCTWKKEISTSLNQVLYTLKSLQSQIFDGKLRGSRIERNWWLFVYWNHKRIISTSGRRRSDPYTNKLLGCIFCNVTKSFMYQQKSQFWFKPVLQVFNNCIQENLKDTFLTFTWVEEVFQSLIDKKHFLIWHANFISIYYIQSWV